MKHNYMENVMKNVNENTNENEIDDIEYDNLSYDDFMHGKKGDDLDYDFGTGSVEYVSREVFYV